MATDDKLTIPNLPSIGASSLDPLYARNPGTVATPTTTAQMPAAPQVAQAQAGAVGAVERASGGSYQAQTREIGANELADAQLARITSQDSPLMKRARQEGILSAARRGLQNSSIAAGTAEGALVDRAAPIAGQNAEHLLRQGLANQEATNRAREVGATLSTQASISNSQEANRLTALRAQLDTAVSQGNATEANNIRMEMSRLATSTNQLNANLAHDAARATAADTNQMRMTVLQQNAELNRQFLSGTQAMDLATIQGRYNQLISTNETAANLFNAYFNSIAQTMANKDITPERVAAYVRVNQDMLEAGLKMIDQMNGVDLSAFKPPTVTGTAGTITSTPAGQTPTQPSGFPTMYGAW